MTPQIWIPLKPTPCTDSPDMFTELKNLDRKYKREAKRLCIEDCEFTEICLETALAEERGAAANGRYGIRGGLDPRERHYLHLSKR